MSPQDLCVEFSKFSHPCQVLKSFVQTDLHNPHFMRGLLIGRTPYKDDYQLYDITLPLFTLSKGRDINLEYSPTIKIKSGYRFYISNRKAEVNGRNIAQYLDQAGGLNGIKAVCNPSIFGQRHFTASPELCWNFWRLRDHMINSFLIEDFSKTDQCARKLAALPPGNDRSASTIRDAHFILNNLSANHEKISKFIDREENRLREAIIESYAV